MSVPDRDPETGTETTGHDWDGIRELDTPLPRWWLWTLYLTIVWGVAYTIAYPAWPLISSATAGVMGYSSRAEVAEAIAANAEANAEITARVASASFAEIASDPALNDYAQSGGAAVFRTYCAQCHGAGAAGAKGYPNLIDDDWLWGGTHEAIATTVRHGIRWGDDDDTRISEMPAFGRDEILTKSEIGEVADYVLSLSGQASATEVGAEIYADNCAACHGDEGKGNQDLGAPDLSNAIWLYGSDRNAVIQTITNARYGVMPAWNTRLTESEIRQVAHYVFQLGGGEQE